MVDRTLAWFNALDAGAAERELAACNAAPRFATEIAAGRPYRTIAELTRTAATVAAGLRWDEVETALAAHPRIGERAGGDRPRRPRPARAVRGGPAAPRSRAALAAGNRAYEERFGHVFLICAAGRSRSGCWPR